MRNFVVKSCTIPPVFYVQPNQSYLYLCTTPATAEAVVLDEGVVVRAEKLT